MADNVIKGDPLGVIQGTSLLSDNTKSKFESDFATKVTCETTSGNWALLGKTRSYRDTSKINYALNLDINTNNLQTFDNFTGAARTDIQATGVHKEQSVTLLTSVSSRVCSKEINLIDFSPLEDHVAQADFAEICGNTTSVSTNMGDHEDPNCRRSFLVMYLGSAVLDRRYPPQSIMPWVMAEVRRRKEPVNEVMLEVLSHSLRAVTVSTESDVWHPHALFHHPLHSLSRFAKSRQERRCFAYLTRTNFYSDFECHVFLAHEEQMVPELFTQIRDATQLDLFSDMGFNRSEAAKAFYEVMYIGKANVPMKKLSSTQVDELAEKLTVKKLEMKEKFHFEDDRQRHASGTSVESLPSNLEDHVSVLENDLVKQHVQFRIYELHTDSPPSSADELAVLSDGLSSSENILESSSNISNSSESKENLSDSCLNKETIPILNTVEKNNFNNFRNLNEDANKTMLFCLSQYDVSLISLNKKSTFLERQFRDISSVSQGNQRSEVFCFIAREKNSIFICHLMKCHSGSVVDEIMTALRVAFKTAYEQNRQQICTMCPLHQLHKLCQEVNGVPPQLAYEMIHRRLQQLPDKDTVEVFTDIKNENPQSYEETVEVLMIGLKRLCELKQREHSHISDTGKISSKSEFNILDNRSKSTTAFENLKKAKQSLANSFETLLRGRKKDDIYESFRQRSGTTDSDSSWTGQSVDSSAPNTPDGSPTPSPSLATTEANFTFSSPTSSPKSIRRPRSCTLGAIPDLSHFESQRCKDLSHLDSKDSSMRRPGAQSPMRHMFLLAGSSTAESCCSSPFTSPCPDLSSPLVTPTNRRRSWRQAIFNRVVTPARIPTTPTVPEAGESDYIDGSHGYSMSRQVIRDLWKKAIMETLLLIRMEKENQDLRARQDEVETKRKKLDYQEITPCLKEVTKVWDEMLLTPGKSDILFDQGKLLSCLKQGVPRSKRGDIWWLMIEQHRLRYPNLEEEAPEVEYTDLLRQLTTHQHAILIDLGRTFPGHPYFETQLGPGQLSLFNILKAYSLLDKEVGYCQGLSFVAGILLMHMDETQAFEAVRHMMYNLGMRKQYRPNMISLQIQLYQLTRLIHDHYKDLYDHFEENDIAPTLYAAPWFLTLFASQFPLGFVARVFDLIFLQGVEVIFKVALVLLGNHKELIMHCDSFETIVEFVKTTLPEMGIIQMERIINQAFELDLTKQLQAYEVEYHVLREEMIYSPQRGEMDVTHKLEQANRKLKQQTMELLEKLQQANSQQHSLEITIHNHQTEEAKLKSHIRTLEIERAALLNAVSKLKRSVPEDEFQKLDITLPVLLPSLPASPVHTPVKHTKSQTAVFQDSSKVLCPSKLTFCTDTCTSTED